MFSNLPSHDEVKPPVEWVLPEPFPSWDPAENIWRNSPSVLWHDSAVNRCVPRSVQRVDTASKHTLRAEKHKAVECNACPDSCTME